MSTINKTVYTITVAPDGMSGVILFDGERKYLEFQRPVKHSLRDALFLAEYIARTYGFKNKPHTKHEQSLSLIGTAGKEQVYRVYEIVEGEEPLRELNVNTR